MTKIKSILVICVGYNSQNLNEALAPWVTLRNGIKDEHGNFTQPPSNIDWRICCATGLFKERRDLGEQYNNKDIPILREYLKSHAIDQVFEITEGVYDYESRDLCWQWAKPLNVDLVWEFDSFDEYYSQEEILKAIEWIEKNDLYTFYRIRFKNFFGLDGSKTYVKDFTPPRIIWNKPGKRIDKFHWDNEVTFYDGSQTPNCSNIVIPERIIHPKHLSWVGSPEFLKRKIAYQKRALKCCSYRFNDKESRLEFDSDYYSLTKQPFPEIFIDES